MYGPSDAGYQARLKKLTAQQQEWNATATAAHEAAQTELFKTGVAAKNNTADQTACIGKLLSDIQQNKELPLVLAVRRWTSGMMGRAAKAVHSHGYGIVFLGDCAEVVDLAGTKNRTSVCIAQHWLRAFPDRKGQFKQKRDARDVLAEETVFPCLNQPEDSLARPRAHLRAQQAKAAAVAVPAEEQTLTQQLYREIKGMLEDPADGSWNNIRKRQVDKLSAKVGELSQETQLTAQQAVWLKYARAVLAAGGPYVSDTEGESDSDSDSESEIEREGGHHWRCCKERCVCQYSSGIGAEVA